MFKLSRFNTHLLGFALFCTALVVGPTLACWIAGPSTAVIVAASILVFAWMIRKWFVPETDSSRLKIQLASLSAITATSSLFFAPKSKLERLYYFLEDRFHLPHPNEPSVWLGAFVLAFVALIVLALNSVWFRAGVSQPPRRLRAATRDNQLAIDGKHFFSAVTRYCNALVYHLDAYDRQVNWSDNELTPLEAQVEMERRGSLQPRIVKDLVTAIRTDRSNPLFLVIGDPGSGKSVSMRRLCRVMCRQAQSTGVVPVYANLREWNDQEPPTTESILGFTRRSVREATGRDGSAFLETWYTKLREEGRLFYIFDSFDELPSIMDCDDKSDAHRRVSEAFARFLRVEVQSCRGVIASRQFRQPIGIIGRKLIVRPFHETQIRHAMRLWLQGRGVNTDDIVKRIFRERPELAPVLRNPFTAELMAQFVRAHPATPVPQSIFAIFDSYINNRMDEDDGQLKSLNLTKGEVLDAATHIAWEMYNAEGIGLELDENELTRFFGGLSAKDVSNRSSALCYIRLARTGGVGRRRFSFVHRRFAEFFVVRAMQKRGQLPDADSIPKDSRWRDCLVVYCGVAPESERKRIAEACWTTIRGGLEFLPANRVVDAIGAVHSLRFINDAFRGNTSPLAGFLAPLSELILTFLGGENILAGKIAAEAIPLIDPSRQSAAMLAAFDSGSIWISQAALGSCRHLARIEPDAHAALRRYIRQLPTGVLIREFGDIEFSLSLSDAMRPQLIALRLDVLWLLFQLAMCLIDITILAMVSLTKMVLLALLMPTSLLMFFPLIFPYRVFKRKIPLARRVFVGRGLLDLLVRMYLACFTEMFLFLLIDSSFNRRHRIIVRSIGVSVSFLVGVTGIVAILPWDEWLNLWRALRKPLDVLRQLAALLLAGAAIGTIIWLDNRYHFVDWRIVYIILGVGASCILALMVILRSLLLWRSMWDNKLIKRTGLPARVTRDYVYSRCSALRTIQGRKRFLELLRERQIPVDGPNNPPPAVLGNIVVREELARLEEHWAELDA